MAAAFFILAGGLAFGIGAISMFVLFAAGVHATLDTQARCRQMARAAFAACLVCAFLAWWNW